MKTLPPAVVVAMILALVASCGGKKEGGSCKGSENTCLDKKNAVVCRGEKLTRVACNGPLGCSKFEDHANCDDSIASAGDACMGLGDEEYACSPDRKRALVCKGGVFATHLECRGGGGCSQLGQQLSCDTSLAAKGDPCKAQGAVSCTPSGAEMVVCRDGKFVLHRYCRGPKHCVFEHEQPTCDETLSMDGDPCGHEGRVVCAVDGEVELICRGSQFIRSRACRKTGCKVQNSPGRPVICD